MTEFSAVLVLNRHSRQGTYIQGPAVSKSDGEISWEVHLSKVAAETPGRAEHRQAIAPLSALRVLFSLSSTNSALGKKSQTA